jgi:hypothetical protein
MREAQKIVHMENSESLLMRARGNCPRELGFEEMPISSFPIDSID